MSIDYEKIQNEVASELASELDRELREYSRISTDNELSAISTGDQGQHSELPWALNLGWEGSECDVVDAHHKGIAMIDIDRTGEREANAALIVKAVNSHHELVEALRNIAGDDQDESMLREGTTAHEFRKIARAALAKAGE